MFYLIEPMFGKVLNSCSLESMERVQNFKSDTHKQYGFVFLIAK